MLAVIKTLILLNLFSFSYQTCSRFEQADLSIFDFGDLINSVSKLAEVPKLFATAGYETLDQVTYDIESFNSGKNNEDAQLSMTELVQKCGYNVEEHKVTTKDGYILTLFRIFGENTKKKVVFLNHGFLGSSVDWIMAQEQSLPYLLAEQGYDVWLGNNRGNKYSRNHVSISPECAEFWDFSFDDMGLHDLPASIDYVLEKTGQEKLFYVGYSQGTTIFFIMTSMLPEYNDKIYEMFAFAPIAWVTNMKSPLLRILATEHDLLMVLLKGIGLNEFAPSDVLTKALAGVLCANNPLSGILCHNIPNLLLGFDKDQANMNYLYTIYQHFPAGAATNQLQHFAQGIVAGQFRRFDHGKNKNIAKYGSGYPPSFNVTNITAKVNLFYSASDWFSSDKDVLKLSKNLGNLGKMMLIDEYNHLDYLWAINVKEKIYDTVLEIINKVQ